MNRFTFFIHLSTIMRFKVTKHAPLCVYTLIAWFTDVTDLVRHPIKDKTQCSSTNLNDNGTTFQSTPVDTFTQTFLKRNYKITARFLLLLSFQIKIISAKYFFRNTITVELPAEFIKHFSVQCLCYLTMPHWSSKRLYWKKHKTTKELQRRTYTCIQKCPVFEFSPCWRKKIVSNSLFWF